MEINECDQLRLPGTVCKPDVRTQQRLVESQYEAIARFKLNETVPIDVVTHFETAKNLYLYAWFVYRFYPVSEQQALASLEFALRERFPDLVKEQKGQRGFGLKKLMNHAIENNHINNEMFTTREHWAWNRAEMRHSFEKMQEMMAAGLESMEWSNSEVVVTQEDLDCDWLGIFKETIPKIRNEYAHGSGQLKPADTHTFEMVVEIINQLYPKKI
ncbi:MAG: hypothetical protein PHG89_05050 [Gallionella sp.]|nr:hypothetical protein [Gallionella sp.]